jgi:hypothetical protein
MKGNKNMNRMEIAVSSLAGKDAEKAYSDMSAACNVYGIDRQAFVELILSQEPKIKKLWTNICWHWVKKLSRVYSLENYDDRNKQS